MGAYRALIDQRGNWGGQLVLLCGPGCAQDGAPTAVSIAGGATLAVDSNALSIKAAMRAAYLDFVVNSLDEALRALKNEIRRKRALSVGLIADVNATLTEMVERGVQPDLEVAYRSHDARDAALIDALDSFLKRRNAEPIRHDAPFPSAETWRSGNPCYFVAEDASKLRGLDEALLAVLPLEDFGRRRWIERVPRYLREARSGGRWIWLSGTELESLAAKGITPQPR